MKRLQLITQCIYNQKVSRLTCFGLTVWEEFFGPLRSLPSVPFFKVCFPVRLYKPNHFRLDACFVRRLNSL